MEKKIKKSLICAAIMGIILPTFSLVYVRKEKVAVMFMLLLACSTLALVYTPLVYFPTASLIFLFFQAFLWIFTFFLGLHYASQGVSVYDVTKDQGFWISCHLILLVFVIVMLSNVPVGFFVTKNAYLDFEKNEVIVVQKDSTFQYLRVQDSVVFIDSNYEEALGTVIALPGDVLRSEDGKVFRNDKPTDISINLPAKPWIVPENIVLIYYKSQDLPHASVFKNKNAAVQNTDKANAEYQAVILPAGRLKNKALYVLLSTDFSRIGQSASANIIPQ